MKLKPGFVLRPFADGYIAADVRMEETQLLITMNKTGAFLWERLQSETTREALLQALTEHYQAPKQLLMEDLEQFLKKLKDSDLLE